MIFSEKHYYLNKLREFLKQKSKQFSMPTALQTFPLDTYLGDAFFKEIRGPLEAAPLDKTNEVAHELGFRIVRYNPENGDVDNSINEFCFIEGKINKKLTNSLMLYYLNNEGGQVILTYLGFETPMYFISATSEKVAVTFLESHLPHKF